MEAVYVVRWGIGGEFRCDSIQQASGHILLQLLRGYSEVRISIEPRT